MGAIRDPELVGDGQKQRVGRRDGLVGSELFNEAVRLGGITAAEDRPSVWANKADLVRFLALAAEIGMVPIIHQREDAAAYRDARLAPMAALFPGVAEYPDLRRLLDVERLAGLIVLERRRLQIHAELRRPGRSGVGAGAPPDSLAQAL